MEVVDQIYSWAMVSSRKNHNLSWSRQCGSIWMTLWVVDIQVVRHNSHRPRTWNSEQGQWRRILGPPIYRNNKILTRVKQWSSRTLAMLHCFIIHSSQERISISRLVHQSITQLHLNRKVKVRQLLQRRTILLCLIICSLHKRKHIIRVSNNLNYHRR